MPDSHRIAERLLAIFTSREHAATIVGDLAENAAARNGAGFWPAVASTAIALAWRPAAVILAGVAIEYAYLVAYAFALNAHQSSSHSNLPQVPAMILGFSSVLISMVGIFNVAFHGFRDTVTRLTLALTLIGWIGGLLQFIPAVRFAELAASAGILIFAALSDRFRPALATLIVTVFLSYAVFVSIMFYNFRDHGAHVRIPLPVNFALMLVVQIAVSSGMRRRVAIR